MSDWGSHAWNTHMDKVSYDIRTKTGTNALDTSVEIELRGTKGAVTFTLNKVGRNDFEAGAEDLFEMVGPKDIGIVQQATILKGPSSDDYWSLDWIHVRNFGQKKNVRGTLLINNAGGFYPETVVVKKCPHRLGFIRHDQIDHG